MAMAIASPAHAGSRGSVLNKSRIAAAALVIAATCSSSALAGLAGSWASANYYYNGFLWRSNFAFGTVNGSTLGEFSDPVLIFALSANDSQIIADFSRFEYGSSSWNPSPVSLNSNGLFIENGFAVSFAGAPQITGVTVDASTNMVGFDQSKITFNNGAIAVNWVGLQFTPSTRVVLNVTTVPAPGAVALLGLAGLARRRRR